MIEFDEKLETENRLYLTQRLTGVACEIWSQRLAALARHLECEIAVRDEPHETVREHHKLRQRREASVFYQLGETWRECCETLGHNPTELSPTLPGGDIISKHERSIKKPDLPSDEIARMLQELVDEIGENVTAE